jgi:hypothetical protein
VAGTFHPAPGSLAEFNAEDYTGDWTITVIDAQVGNSGRLTGWGVILTLSPVITSIEETVAAELPKEFLLHPNYPNPFNPITTIRYDLKESVNVTLKIYNILGQEVRTLVNERQTAGYKSVDWDARNDVGVNVASGIYIYKLEAGSFIQARKMVLLR